VSECDDVISKIYMLVDKYHVPPSSVETEFFPYFF